MDITIAGDVRTRTNYGKSNSQTYVYTMRITHFVQLLETMRFRQEQKVYTLFKISII